MEETRAFWTDNDLKGKVCNEEDRQKRQDLVRKWLVKNAVVKDKELPDKYHFRTTIGKSNDGPTLLGTSTDDAFYMIQDVDLVEERVNKELRKKGGTEK